MDSGTRLGAYEILEQLGVGGMGEVYRARDTALERDVAIKVLPEAVVGDAEKLARFRREAKLLAQLNHPNIVTIHAVEEAEGAPFLVMELVEGHTLGEEMADREFSLERFLDLAGTLADAVAAAHDKGITHRDLKPANVMLTDGGRVKVLDFGLAKFVEHSRPAAMTGMPTEVLTQEGMAIGTLPYMSPEQLEGKQLDHRTDIFSLGVLFYEMMTGSRPFRGDTQPALMSAILRDEPRQIAEVRDDLPQHLGRVVGRCLEKDPEHRYQTAASLARELERLRKESDSAAAGADARPSGGAPPAPGTTDEKSIAVLPFLNRSGNPDDQYFSDGLSEELINALGRLPGIRVTARSSAFQFRGQELDARDVGEKLGVEAVLEGSVRIAGQRLRITIELVNCADGYQLWSERFDGEMKDIFDTQDEIVRSIVKQFELEMASDDVPAVKRETDNLEAYHLLLRARHHAADFWEPGLVKAIACLEQAVELDPNYALAHAEMATWYLMRSNFGTLTGKEAFPQIRKWVLRALELDPQLGDAHAMYGIYLAWHDLNWEAGENELRRALELSPENVWNHFYYAAMLSTARRGDAIVPHVRRMAELDPLNPIINAHVGFFLFYAGRHEEALVELEKSRELFPDFWFLHYELSFLRWQQRDGEAAIEAMRKAIDMTDGQIGFLLCLIAAMNFDFGHHGEGERWMAHVEKLAETIPISSFGLSLVEIVRGNADEAIASLERGREEHDTLFVWTRTFCEVQGFTTDERILQAMERLGLP